MKKRPAIMVVLILLCLCVVVQMLGVPATLLDPSAAYDPVGGSVLEGFSVPPSLIEITPSPTMAPAADVQSISTRPVLTTVPFHPPVLPFFG